MIVALDSEAFNALAGGASIRKQRVRRILRAAQRLNRDAVVPALVLAELYRGRGHNQLVDACLARESASLATRDTDRNLARLVGGVLAAAGADSSLIVDAHVVAVAVEAGGGVIVAGDEPDLTRLAAAFPHIVARRRGKRGRTQPAPVRPPLFDSPATLGLFDDRVGTLLRSDRTVDA